MKWLFFSLGLSVLVLAGCDRSGKPVHIVLPNGFTGEFRIVKDSHRGQHLVQENECWVFRIPVAGTLYVKDDWPFYRWHTGTVQYENGEYVVTEDLGTSPGSRSTGPNSSEGSTDYDGTTHRWRVAAPR